MVSLLRAHYFDWPPNRDVSAYATIGHELLNGKALYVDVWDQKPPAIYAVYAAAEAIFGYGPLQIQVLGLVTALLILFGVHRAATACSGSPSAGFWAAALWALLSGDLQLQTHDPNTEAFMNVCATWGFVWIVEMPAKGGVRRASLVGALFAVASLFKPVIIAVPVALAVAQLACPPRRATRRDASLQIAVMLAVGVAAWSLVAIYFFFTDRIEIFHTTMVTFNQYYAGELDRSLQRGFTLEPIIESSATLQAGLAFVLAASALVLFRLAANGSRCGVLLFAYALGAHVAISLPGKFYAHYFQLWIPVVAIAFGWVTAATARRRDRRWLPHLLAACVAVGLACREQAYYRAAPEEILPGTYAEIYLATQAVGRNLSAVLEPGEGVFQWGQEAGLYPASQRRPPGPILCWHLLRGPLAERHTQRALEDLVAEPPELVILARYFVEWDPNHPVLLWMQERYRAVEPTEERTARHFVAMVRRGGALEARLSRDGATVGSSPADARIPIRL
jgi:hypothetical protein